MNRDVEHAAIAVGMMALEIDLLKSDLHDLLRALLRLDDVVSVLEKLA